MVDVWKDREPSRMANATMRDFVNRNILERIIVVMERRRLWY